jgi:hypothetical protein
MELQNAMLFAAAIPEMASLDSTQEHLKLFEENTLGRLIVNAITNTLSRAGTVSNPSPR